MQNGKGWDEFACHRHKNTPSIGHHFKKKKWKKKVVVENINRKIEKESGWRASLNIKHCIVQRKWRIIFHLQKYHHHCHLQINTFYIKTNFLQNASYFKQNIHINIIIIIKAFIFIHTLSYIQKWKLIYLNFIKHHHDSRISIPPFWFWEWNNLAWKEEKVHHVFINKKKLGWMLHPYVNCMDGQNSSLNAWINRLRSCVKYKFPYFSIPFIIQMKEQIWRQQNMLSFIKKAQNDFFRCFSIQIGLLDVHTPCYVSNKRAEK